jgi:hypothetical protein
MMGGMSTPHPKPLHIFKAGRRTAMSGATLDFSEADLAATAAAYDPAKHEAPIVVGHPKLNGPAFGWISSVSAAGGDLEAKARAVDPEFAELVRAERYKKISASFFAPDSPSNPVPGVYYLRHVGFLGATAPAVKGLRAVEFSDSDEGVIEFADWGDLQNASMWRRMRDFLIAQFGLDKADQVIPDYAIGTLEDAARAEDENSSDSACGSAASFSDPNHPEILVTPEQKAAALEAENAQLKQQIAAASAAAAAAAADKRHTDHLAYAEQLITDGLLAPKNRDLVVAMLDFADGDEPLEFGEGDAKQPLADAVKAFLGEQPKVVEFGELATKDRAVSAADAAGATGSDVVEFAAPSGFGVDPEQLARHQRVAAYAKQHNLSYEQALAAVQ